MNNPFEQAGAFSWTELMTNDLPGAKAFYGALFGWDMQDRPMEGMTYTVLSAGGEQIGGMVEAPPNAAGMPSTWGTYVTVTDVDTVAARTVELGGKVLLEPRDIKDVGRFALIQDPQGAVLSAISYGPGPNKMS